MTAGDAAPHYTPSRHTYTPDAVRDVNPIVELAQGVERVALGTRPDSAALASALGERHDMMIRLGAMAETSSWRTH